MRHPRKLGPPKKKGEQLESRIDTTNELRRKELSQLEGKQD